MIHHDCEASVSKFLYITQIVAQIMKAFDSALGLRVNISVDPAIYIYYKGDPRAVCDFLLSPI
jgi:hypothetical protein